eukprot:c27284_g1_i1.p1 GENE.c27284_g1_i1~~c27284_g1_i1.p1  ORF type:complete len:346 (+),score=82.21 c27284_g1_i1:93-1130(+)
MSALAMDVTGPQSLWGLCGVVSNVLSSVGVILFNKYLLDSVHLECILFLTAAHHFASWVPLYFMAASGQLIVRPVQFMENLKLCVSLFVTVAFFNLSLQYNSLGNYQLGKLIVTPTIAAAQYLFYGTATSRRVALALFGIFFGVVYASLHDTRVNVLGLAASAIGILSSSYYSLTSKVTTSDLMLEPAQQNFHIFPLTAVMFLVASLIFERNPVGQIAQLFRIDLEPRGSHSLFAASADARVLPVTGMMLLTTLMAASLNNSTVKLDAANSPLMVTMVGNVKLALILLLGVLVMNSTFSIHIFAGMALALASNIAYSVLRLSEVVRKEKIERSASVENLEALNSA